jgi:predicted nucleotidyltransferase
MDISGKISPEFVAVYRTVSVAAEALGIPYVVVGAAARDLVLHYGYGARITRATVDVDFGIQVPDPATYEELRRRLELGGFKTTKTAHRLSSEDGTIIDIVPFGQIAGKDGHVLLPPEETHKLNVIGFQEACANADLVTVQTKPKVTIPVASPAGLVLLKLVAWTDREAGTRKKDAADLAYLMENYELIPAVSNALYGAEVEVLKAYDWDISLGGAHLLGNAAASIASRESKSVISNLFNDKIKGWALESLRYEMCRSQNDESELERKSALLDAFINGVLQS